MNTRDLARRAVGWYPRAWRDRYAEEVLDVLDQHQVTLRTVADLLVNAATARLDPAYRGRRPWRFAAAAVAGTVFLYGGWTAIGHEATDFGVTGAHDVAYSADSRLVLTDGGDRELRLWDVADPARPHELSRFRGGENATLSPDGRTVATLADAVVLWDVRDPARPRKGASLLGKGAEAEAAEFAPDGRMLATGYHDTVILFDVTDPQSPRRLTALPEHPRPVAPQTFMRIVFSADGRMLASTAGDSDRATLWDIADPAHPVVRGSLPSRKDARMVFLDETTFAIADDGRVVLWNVADPAAPEVVSIVDATATTGGRLGFQHNALELGVVHGGRILITVMNNLKASAWDVSDPRRPVHLNDVVRVHAGPGIFRISPDGRSVVSADRPERDTIQVWGIGETQT